MDLSGDRVEQHSIGEGKLALGIPATDVLTMSSCGLSEPIVEEASAGPADPIEDAVEDLSAALVLVEAQFEEVVHEPTGLRQAERVDELHPRDQRFRIRIAGDRGLLQVCSDVTNCREAEASDEGIFRKVRELVEPALLEWRPHGQQPDGSIVDIFPTGRRYHVFRIRIMHADGEIRLRPVQSGGRIRERRGHRGRVVDHELLQGRTDNGGAIRIPRNGNRDRLTAGASCDRRLPAALNDRVSLTHQEPDPGIGGRRRIVATGCGIVHDGKGHGVPAVVDVEEHAVIAAGRVDRSQDVDVGRILDHAADISRREREIGDHPIAAVVRGRLRQTRGRRVFHTGRRRRTRRLGRWAIPRG